jgi:hypothetical protein
MTSQHEHGQHDSPAGVAKELPRAGQERETRPQANGYGPAAVDAMRQAMTRWRDTAVRELARHTPVEGLCRVCGAARPCPICERAELALGSL